MDQPQKVHLYGTYSQTLIMYHHLNYNRMQTCRDPVCVFYLKSIRCVHQQYRSQAQILFAERQSNLKDFIAAVNAATTYKLISDPLHLSVFYEKFSSLIPDIHKDDTSLLLFLIMAIALAYTSFIASSLVCLHTSRY